MEAILDAVSGAGQEADAEAARTAAPLPLFVYGTLRDADLLAGLLGRPLAAATCLAAAAPNWRAVRMPGRAYPALIRAPGAAAAGLVLSDLTPFERDLLDAYEGAEYRRRPLAVMIDVELFEAEAYLPRRAIPATAPDWRLADWQVNHKPRILVAELEAAAELRRGLLAIRPN